MRSWGACGVPPRIGDFGALGGRRGGVGEVGGRGRNEERSFARWTEFSRNGASRCRPFRRAFSKADRPLRFDLPGSPPFASLPPSPLQLYERLAELWAQSTGTIRIDLRRPTIPESDVRPNLFESVPVELWPSWLARGDSERGSSDGGSGWGLAWGNSSRQDAAGWDDRAWLNGTDAWEGDNGNGGAQRPRRLDGGESSHYPHRLDGAVGAEGAPFSQRFEGTPRAGRYPSGLDDRKDPVDARDGHRSTSGSSARAPRLQPSAPALGAEGSFPSSARVDPHRVVEGATTSRAVGPRAPSPVVAFRVESEELSRAPSPRSRALEAHSIPRGVEISSHPIPHSGAHVPQAPFPAHESAFRAPLARSAPQADRTPNGRWEPAEAEAFAHGGGYSPPHPSGFASGTPSAAAEASFGNPLADTSAFSHPFSKRDGEELPTHWSDELPPPPRLAAALAALARDPAPPRPATRPVPAGGGLGRLGRKGRAPISLPATGARVRVLRHWRLGAVPPPESARVGAPASSGRGAGGGARAYEEAGRSERRARPLRPRWWPFGRGDPDRSSSPPRGTGYPSYPGPFARPRHLDDGWSAHERRSLDGGPGSPSAAEAAARKPWWTVLRDGGVSSAGPNAPAAEAAYAGQDEGRGSAGSSLAPFSRGLGERAVALAQWREAAPIDVAAGFSIDLDTAALKPVLGVRCGPHLELRALPEASIRASGRLPLRSLGAAVRLSYECPVSTLSTPFAPPATLKAFLEPLRPAGLRVTPRGIDLDARAPLDGGRASARIDASLLAPTALPVRRDGHDKIQVRVRRLGVSWMW